MNERKERQINWKAIQEIIGLSNEDVASIKDNWGRKSQTPEEVRSGILHEGRMRIENYSKHLEKARADGDPKPEGFYDATLLIEDILKGIPEEQLSEIFEVLLDEKKYCGPQEEDTSK